MGVGKRLKKARRCRSGFSRDRRLRQGWSRLKSLLQGLRYAGAGGDNEPCIIGGDDMRAHAMRWLLPLLVCFSLGAQASVPLHPAETDKAKFVRLTLALEADPLTADGRDIRGWLMDWAVKTPDYVVTVCGILGPIPGDDKVPNGPELLMQQMFGNAAYQIQHPGQANGVSEQIAGMESLLRAYQSILVKQQDAHIAYFDDLLAKQHDGSFKGYMSGVVAKECKKT